MSKAFSKLASTQDVMEQYGQRAGHQLLRVWHRTQPRWLDVTLVSAENIAPVKSNGLSDAYCLLTLIPANEHIQEREVLKREGSFNSMKNLMTGSFRVVSMLRQGSSSSLQSLSENAFFRGEGDAESESARERELACESESPAKPVSSGAYETYDDSFDSLLTAGSDIPRTDKGGDRSLKSYDPSLAEHLSPSSAGDIGSETKTQQEYEDDGRKNVAAAVGAQMYDPDVRTELSVSSLREYREAQSRHQYAKVKSKCIQESLSPVFNQSFEMHLEGGSINSKGDYHNELASFTKFRLTMCNHSTFKDDFLGEVTVPLAPLMSCRSIEGWYDLQDPEGLYVNHHHRPLSGRVYLKLKWNFDCLLEGSTRPQATHDPHISIFARFLGDEEGHRNHDTASSLVREREREIVRARVCVCIF